MDGTAIIIIEALLIVVIIPLASKLINNGIVKREAKRETMLARIEENSERNADAMNELKAMNNDFVSQFCMVREHLAITRKNVLKLVIMNELQKPYDRLEAYHEYIKNGWNHEVEETGRKLILQHKEAWKEVLADKGIKKTYEEQMAWIDKNIFTGN